MKSFDLYQPSWEFLKDSPKFVSITFEQAAAPERTQCKLFSPNGSIDTPGLDTPVKPQPIGKKKRAKRQQEEEKILQSVTEKLKGDNSGSASVVLANALTQFANVFASGLKEFQGRQAYDKDSPTFKKRYDNLIISACIKQLEKRMTAKRQKQQPSITTTIARSSQQPASTTGPP